MRLSFLEDFIHKRKIFDLEGQSTFSPQTLATCQARTGYGGNYYCA
ncbi:unnamed protein product [Nezara viridula]|uniref:Uncharacterized protein n=1 Tax=Nezara viridula TaxID=85310 RepID=A0A9P0E586_NEZVI|nr:unnamed protein product [Nezara viridula]